jgi:hypothetical protein
MALKEVMKLFVLWRKQRTGVNILYGVEINFIDLNIVVVSYLKGVIFGLLILICFTVNLPIGIAIIVIGSIIGFILGFEIDDDVCKTIMIWPIIVLDKLFGGDHIHRI